MEASPVVICRTTTDYVVGFSKGLAIAFWRYHTNAGDVPELEAAARRAHKACGQSIGLIQVVPASAITPDGPARSALASMLRQLNGIVSHSAIVHEAEGFRAAMIRSIVTGVAALSNPGFPHRVFSKVPEAATWMNQESERLNALHITVAVTRVRGAILPGKGAAQTTIERAPPRSM